MICNYCEIEFEPTHFNQRLCSAECKKAAIKRAKQKYKETEKGIASNDRWIASERRDENEKRYRVQPHRRKLSVLSSARYLEKHPEAQEKKREVDRLYAKSPDGRRANKQATARYRKTENGREVRRITKARRRGAVGSFSPVEWNALLAEHGYKCAHCESSENIEIDHIVPIALGGTNTIDNVQPLCRSCNSSKGSRYVG